MSYFQLSPPTNMVSDFLGGTSSQTGFLSPSRPPATSFAGTSLGSGFGQNTFSNLPDYSSTFASAINRPSSGSFTSGGFTSGGQNTGSFTGSLGSDSSQKARYQPRSSSTSRPIVPARYFAGSTSFFTPTPKPIEFSLGKAPTLQELNLDYETMGKRAVQANIPYAEQYRQFAPQTEAGTRALSQAGATMATGVLPRDVTGQVGRSAAALGFQTGIGGRSGIGRNLLARDLGLTSLQVQQQGADLLARSSGLAQQAMQAMSPISPQQVFQTAFTQAQYNRELANQNLLNAWLSRPLPGQFDVQVGKYVGRQPGTYSDTRPMTGVLASSPVYGA